jgi:hypothetical protein
MNNYVRAVLEIETTVWRDKRQITHCDPAGSSTTLVSNWKSVILSSLYIPNGLSFFSRERLKDLQLSRILPPGLLEVLKPTSIHLFI